MEYKVNKATLDQIAEAIKQKSHKTGKIKLTGEHGFAESILALPQSGEGADVQLTKRLDDSYDINIIDDGSHVTVFQEGYADPKSTEETYYPEEGYAGFSSFTVGPGGSGGGGGGAGIKFELSGSSFSDPVFNDFSVQNVFFGVLEQVVEEELFGPDFNLDSNTAIFNIMANADIALEILVEGTAWLVFKSCGTLNFSSYRLTSGDAVFSMMNGSMSAIDPFSMENDDSGKGSYYQIEMPSMNIFNSDNPVWGPITAHMCMVRKTVEETEEGDIYTWTAKENNNIMPSEELTSMMSSCPVKFSIFISDKGYRPLPDNMG